VHEFAVGRCGGGEHGASVSEPNHQEHDEIERWSGSAPGPANAGFARRGQRHAIVSMCGRGAGVRRRDWQTWGVLGWKTLLVHDCGDTALCCYSWSSCAQGVWSRLTPRALGALPRASAHQAGEKVKQMIFDSLLVDLTPLQSAAKFEAPDVARALLEHGVSATGRQRARQAQGAPLPSITIIHALQTSASSWIAGDRAGHPFPKPPRILAPSRPHSARHCAQMAAHLLPALVVDGLSRRPI
jgi:hypothetical protein